jgi:hypothetical protein
MLVRRTLELGAGHTHERRFARRFGYDACNDIREIRSRLRKASLYKAPCGLT